MQYDIIIVGAGIVGSTLALTLAKQTNLSIALLESKAIPSYINHPNFPSAAMEFCTKRVSAINLASVRILQNLNIWPRIKNTLSPFKAMEAWEAHTHNKINFNSQTIAEPVLGFIAENEVIQTALYQAIAEEVQIDLLHDIKLSDLKITTEKAQVFTKNNTIFEAKLIIGADGPQSFVRTKANIPVDYSDYSQQALVATVETSLPHHFIARQIFLSDGPLAFLPLNNENYCSIVWSLPHQKSASLLALNDTLFAKELTHAFEFTLGEIKKVSPRHTFNLYKQTTHAYVQHRIALVGDCAHVVHPLAGQGLNIGLLDANALAHILAAHSSKIGWDNLSILRRYERWRKAENMALLSGIDLINGLFTSEASSLKIARKCGLTTVNYFDFIKRQLIHYAVGNTYKNTVEV